MNVRRTITSMFLILTLAACGTTSPKSLRDEVRWAQLDRSGNINVHLVGDSAYLHGHSTYLDRQLAARAALAHPDVKRVYNYVVHD